MLLNMARMLLHSLQVALLTAALLAILEMAILRQQWVLPHAVAEAREKEITPRGMVLSLLAMQGVLEAWC